MPYIKPEDQEIYLTLTLQCTEKVVVLTRHEIGEALGLAMRNGGDLQYMLAVAFQTFLEKVGLRYAYCEGIKGALLGALDEFHDLIVRPYERVKEKENGSIYNFEKLMALMDGGNY